MANNTVNKVIIFAVGAAVGACATYLVMSKKNQETKDGYEAVKEMLSHERAQEDKLRRWIGELKEDLSIGETNYEDVCERLEAAESKVKQYEEREAWFASSEENDPYVDDDDIPFEVTSAEPTAKPSYITDDQFSYEVDYEKHELLYWDDNVISDTNGYYMEDDEIGTLLGGIDFINWKNADEYGYIYIRNSAVLADYAIRKEHRNYVDTHQERPVF